MKTVTCVLFIFCTTLCHAQDKTYAWKHYDIFSVGVDLPDIFSKGGSDAYHTYSFPNRISKNISLSVECLIADAKFTSAAIESYQSDCYHFFDTVMYDYKKGDLFVLSGLDKNKNILYIKGIKKGESYFELDLSYNKKYQYLFDKTLPRMATSFK